MKRFSERIYDEYMKDMDMEVFRVIREENKSRKRKKRLAKSFKQDQIVSYKDNIGRILIGPYYDGIEYVYEVELESGNIVTAEANKLSEYVDLPVEEDDFDF